MAVRAHIPAIGSLAALAALAACGGLENPDLAVGAVSGRVANAAAAGGYVYVLGAPDRLGIISSDGSYAVERVPIGGQQLVVVASSGGVTKAELAPVTVSPGTISQAPERDAAAMSAAGRILAAARPDGYCSGSLARFTVEGTIHQAVAGEAVVLGDLPAGSWNLTTRLPGFLSVTRTVFVDAAIDTLADEELVVDDDDEERGCLSSACSGGLHCNPADGTCYPCLDDSQCGGDELCDPGSHNCVADGTGAGLCESATSADQCATGVLVPVSGGPGYCSLDCAAQSDCPAGWSCAGSPGQCQVLQTCVATRAMFGSACASSSTCQAALVGGKCYRSDDDEPGYCTASCTVDQQCILAGFGTCKSGSSGLSYCRP
jgi:hypothetical protein